MSNSKRPLYIQIKKYLEDQIRQGIYKPHDQLPSEAELANQFDVSRITSKNAILKLVENGKVYRIPGKGTFVKALTAEKSQTSNQIQTRLIGLIMPEVMERHSAKLLSEIEKALSAFDYSLILCQSNHCIEQENKAIEKLLKHNVDGLIIFPIDEEIYSEKILQLTLNKFPIVLIDRYLKGVDTPAVYSNNFQGAYQLTKILLDQDHKKIGLFTPPKFETITINDRIKGYEQALDDARIPIDRSMWFTDIFKENPIDLAVEFLLANPEITSIFSINAYTGKIAIQAAKRLNKSVPNHFSIVSFDQHQELDIYPVYTAKQDLTQIAKKAVNLIQDQINHKKIEKRIVIPVDICFNPSVK